MSFGIWQRTITDDEGNVLPGASIEVRAPSSNFTGALVSLFSDEAGSTGLSNPFNADSEGFAQFYAAPRKVDIRATGSGSQRTWRNVDILGTAAIADVQTSRADVATGKLATFPFAYSQGNILGTVAQSGGVPTGAIIERGSNSNGEYVKFADGTLICTKNQSGVSESFANISVRFAQTFSTIDSIDGLENGSGVGNNNGSGQYISVREGSVLPKNNTDALIVNLQSGYKQRLVDTAYQFTFKAIGRWW